MKTDYEVFEERNKEHLRNAMLKGEYFTERVSVFFEEKFFWEKYKSVEGYLPKDAKKWVSQGTACQPIRLADTGALLVRFTDTDGKHWFAWIHN